MRGEQRKVVQGRREAEPELMELFGLAVAAELEQDVGGAAAQTGAEVRRWRRRRGMSAVELAETVGLTPDKLSKVERGTRRVTVRELPAFAEALGVSTSQLLGIARTAPSGLFAFRAHGPQAHRSRALSRVQALWEVEDRLIKHGAISPAVPHPSVRALTALVEQAFSVRPRTQTEAQRQGRDLANEARRLLDLGTGPLGDLASLAEQLFGVDVVLAPVGDDISGVCAHADGRATVLASSGCVRSHVRFTLAHELAHHLFADPRAIIEETGADLHGTGYEERRASSFAAHFLLPAQGLKSTLAWLEVDTSDVEAMTEPGVIAFGYLMALYGASLPAVAYQLVHLGWLSFERATEITRGYRASAVLEAVRYVFAHGGDWAQASNEDRIPARLYVATLAAAREGKVGLHTVAQLLDREEDDSLFELVMGAADAPLT